MIDDGEDVQFVGNINAVVARICPMLKAAAVEIELARSVSICALALDKAVDFVQDLSPALVQRHCR